MVEISKLKEGEYFLIHGFHTYFKLWKFEPDGVYCTVEDRNFYSSWVILSYETSVLRVFRNLI